MNGLLRAATRLTTPLLPEDFLTLVNALWSTQELRGRVEAVHPETADSATLVIRPGRDWNRHRAGQYVGVGVDVHGVRHWRSYSLTSPVHRSDGRFTITVKAVSDGVVSEHLVRRTRPGTVLALAAPQGVFVLPDPLPRKVLFLTAGSGVTPVMGMLRTHRLPDVVHVHAATSQDSVIFGAELRHMVSPTYALKERYDDHHGRFSVDDLERLCPDWRDRETWLCGPGPLMEAAEVRWTQAGLEDRLHLERFQVRRTTPSGSGGRIAFARSSTAVDVDGETTLLDAGERAGVLMPSGCRMGICYGCLTPLLEGRVRDLRTGDVHGEVGDLVQTCISAPAGAIVLDL